MLGLRPSRRIGTANGAPQLGHPGRASSRTRRVVSVADNVQDTPEEAAYRSQMAAYFDAVINHGEAREILRDLERAVERLAFVRACIIPFTVNAEGDLHQ